MSRFISDSEYVLTLLANRMSPSRAHRTKGGVVFLLGAGCSKQYGLPSFQELLTYLWEDNFHHAPDPALSTEFLRDRLEKYWQAQGPRARKAALEPYLKRIQGRYCPGYLRLAILASKGFVRAIVNMNFDTLLEEALEVCGVPFTVSTSFRVFSEKGLTVYKPHGTIGEVNDDRDVIESLAEISEGTILGEDLHRIKKELANEERNLVEKLVHLREVLDILASSIQSGDRAGLSTHQKSLARAMREFERAKRSPLRGSNELVLDIAKGDLFSDAEEQRSAQDLLTGSDVVVVGYSGVDAKIAAALRDFSKDRDPRDYKLFVVNPSPPDPRLLLPMEERGSRGLLILGQEGTFDDFMEQLERALHPPGSSEPLPEDLAQKREINLGLVTRAEQRAIRECMQLAQSIRSSINVPGRSQISLEDHAQAVYECCLDLANHAGVCLTSPEKYLLCCAAFLHDIGYFAAYAAEDAVAEVGWQLLKNHGENTIKLVRRRLYEDEGVKERVIPASYAIEDWDSILEALLYICRHHTAYTDPAGEDLGDLEIRTNGGLLLVRRRMLLGLFALAEDLVAVQPFLPFPELPSSSERGRWVVEDPVLDLYLRRKQHEVSFTISRGRVTGISLGVSESQTALWFLSMASRFVERFDRRAQESGGWGLKFSFASQSEGYALPAQDRVQEYLEEILGNALQEALESSLKSVVGGAMGESSSILDLIAVYTISGPSREPRVPFEAACVRDAFRSRLPEKKIPPSHNLLYLYLSMRERGASHPMESLFIESFEQIVYPAWRYFARRWRNESSSIPMAQICLDLGSSRFRGEVNDGLRYLLNEILRWNSRNEAHGHDECTLCTSRLLYIFSHARRLFSKEEMTEFQIEQGRRGVNEAVAGLLRYMLGRAAEDDCWWGFGAGSEQGAGFRAPEYLAWAARSIAICLQVDREVSEMSDGDWLEKSCGVDRAQVVNLFRDRWKSVYGLSKVDMLSGENEITDALTLGQIGLACLDLHYMDDQVLELLGENRSCPAFLENLEASCQTMDIWNRSLVDRLHLWPALTLLDREGIGDEEENARLLADLCRECVLSPAWVRQGHDAGSWCFDTKNTQPILTSLTVFWRHAFSHQHRKRFEKAFAQAAKRSARGNKLSSPASGGRTKRMRRPGKGTPHSSGL